MKKGVIFDFDLTLVDSICSIMAGLKKMSEHFSLPSVTEDDLRRVISLPARDFWQGLWGRYDEAWNEYFLTAVSASERENIKLYPDVIPVLTKLKKNGFRLGVATNRDRAWEALAATDLAKYFDTAVGALDVAHPKPAPDSLLLAMEQLQLTSCQVLFVGDSKVDMLAACRARLRGVGILAGGTSREELFAAGAWQVRSTLSDLVDLF